MAVIVGSWWLAGELEIVSVTYEIVKYLSSNKLKPDLFTERGSSISYVINNASLNGVGVIPS